jgi:hypothetical protein
MNEPDIDSALLKIEKGLRKYCWIQDYLHKDDVSRSREFQKTYNGFYRVRRNAAWQEVYYKLMERAKTKPSDFSQILSDLKRKTGRLEASFASKLVATLHPDRPVIDRFVLEHFCLRLPGHYETDREAKAVSVYKALISKYETFLSLPVARIICEKFTATYPWAGITDLKKVDLVLWQTRAT